MKTTVRNHRELQNHLDRMLQLSFEKNAWDISVTKHTNSLSDRQRALYWKWVGIIGDELGYYKNETAEELKRMFITSETYTGTDGQSHEYRRSITKLNTKDMSKLLDRISMWASSEMGIFLPHPEDAQLRS